MENAPVRLNERAAAISDVKRSRWC